LDIQEWVLFSSVGALKRSLLPRDGHSFSSLYLALILIKIILSLLCKTATHPMSKFKAQSSNSKDFLALGHLTLIWHLPACAKPRRQSLVRRAGASAKAGILTFEFAIP
jgi:hypothetical protein